MIQSRLREDGCNSLRAEFNQKSMASGLHKKQLLGEGKLHGHGYVGVMDSLHSPEQANNEFGDMLAHVNCVNALQTARPTQSNFLAAPIKM